MSKVIDAIKAHPLVDSISDERNLGDGYWVYLKTGNCSCCGRHLENKESVELGIGPICRSKWGL